MTPTEAAWLAGLIDGEGYVGVKVNKLKLVSNPDARYYAAQVKVGMTHELTVRRAAELLECKVYKLKARDVWTAELHSPPRILEVAKEVMPYAITKSRNWILAAGLISAREFGNKELVAEFAEELRAATRTSRQMRDISIG